MEEDIVVRVVDLPCGVRGFTIMDEDGRYNIYINAKLNSFMRRKAFEHEMEHIHRGDWQTDLPIWLVEQIVRKAVGEW